MFTLSTLEKVVTSKKQRVGRGEGSNRGKNSGKGHKGQTKRGGGVPIWFTGKQSDAGSGIMARIPKTKGFTALNRKNSITLYVERILATLDKGQIVSMATLLEHGLINEKIKTVKVIKGQADTEKLDLKFDEIDKITLSKGVKELL
jgi:large subunit ribosomal protein L15